MNQDAFRRDFENHRRHQANIARIKRKKIPIHEGRAGTLPPMRAETERRELENTADGLLSKKKSLTNISSQQNLSPVSAVVPAETQQEVLATDSIRKSTQKMETPDHLAEPLASEAGDKSIATIGKISSG